MQKSMKRRENARRSLVLDDLEKRRSEVRIMVKEEREEDCFTHRVTSTQLSINMNGVHDEMLGTP